MRLSFRSTSWRGPGALPGRGWRGAGKNRRNAMTGMQHRNDTNFVHFVVDAMRPLGPVVAKRMFGGHGIFLNDLMFALVAYDTLYFKVDDGNRKSYEERELEPFTYTGQNGRLTRMSYYEAPPEGLDEPELLSSWAQEAYAAARRAGKTSKANRTKKPRH